MKKFLLLFLLILLFQNVVFAEGAGYKYSTGGVIYADVTMPVSLPRAKYNQVPTDKIIPISTKAINNEVDIKTLKSAQAQTLNVLCLVEAGDAGIYKAAKRGNIKTIHYVEYTNERVWIPLGFLPIYFKRYITTVYGE